MTSRRSSSPLRLRRGRRRSSNTRTEIAPRSDSTRCCRFIQATPPSRRLTRTRPRRACTTATPTTRCGVRVVALVEFPVEAIGAIDHGCAFGRLIVLE